MGRVDPDLLTVKAVRAIQDADIIMCPASGEERPSIALSVVESLLDRSRQEIIRLIFPMTKDPDILETTWKRNARIMAETVLTGKDVVYLTVGDPYLYSTWIYMHREALREPPRDGHIGDPRDSLHVHVRIQGGGQHSERAPIRYP